MTEAAQNSPEVPYFDPNRAIVMGSISGAITGWVAGNAAVYYTMPTKLHEQHDLYLQEQAATAAIRAQETEGSLATALPFLAPGYDKTVAEEIIALNKEQLTVIRQEEHAVNIPIYSSIGGCAIGGLVIGVTAALATNRLRRRRQAARQPQGVPLADTEVAS